MEENYRKNMLKLLNENGTFSPLNRHLEKLRISCQSIGISSGRTGRTQKRLRSSRDLENKFQDRRREKKAIRKPCSQGKVFKFQVPMKQMKTQLFLQRKEPFTEQTLLQQIIRLLSNPKLISKSQSNEQHLVEKATNILKEFEAVFFNMELS